MTDLKNIIEISFSDYGVFYIICVIVYCFFFIFYFLFLFSFLFLVDMDQLSGNMQSEY